MSENNGQQITPQPVPTQVNLQVVEGVSGDRFLVMEFNTWTHNAVYFIPAAAAVEFANDVLNHAREAAIGIGPTGIIAP